MSDDGYIYLRVVDQLLAGNGPVFNNGERMEAATSQFCRFLAEHNLFTPLGMQVQDGDKTKNISGCYVINEERLGKLSDELFLSIRAKQYLPAIYAHLLSLGQTERLVTLQKGLAGK